MPDPLDTLAVGVAEDAKAAKKRGKSAAAKKGDEAAAEALDAGSPPDEAEALGTVVEEKVEEATTEAPPSPGDDAESVFDRRLARLTRIVEEAEFDTGTVFGDMRDAILDLFKHRPKMWSAMSAGEQQDTVRHIEGLAKSILGKVVLVVAQDDSDTIQATLLGQFAVKNETIEAKLKIEHADSEVLLDLYQLAGHRVVIVSADDKRFMSTRRDPEIEPDQRDLGLPNNAEPQPKPPADDSDLADGADDDKAIDTWGVFDTDRKEWLIDENGGDDGWTSAITDAGCWSYDDAKRLATDFAGGGEGVVPRQIEA